MIARACSMRNVQAIEAALGDYVISERPLSADEWAAERATQIEASTIVNRTDAAEAPGEEPQPNVTAIEHYIISDQPMTEDEWIMQRTVVEQKKAENEAFSHQTMIEGNPVIEGSATETRHSADTPEDTDT